MFTKKITAFPVTEQAFSVYRDEALKKVIAEAAATFDKIFSALCNEFNERFNNKEWIYLNREGQSEGVYYVNEIVGLIPDLDVHSCNAGYSYHHIDSSYVSSNALTFAGFQGVIPTENEVRKLFNDSLKYFRDNGNGNIKLRGSNYSGVTYLNGNEYRYMWVPGYSTNYYNSSNQSYFWVIPIFRFKSASANPISALKAIQIWIKNNLTPKTFKNNQTKTIFEMVKAKKEYIKITADSVTLDQQKIFDAVKAGKTVDFLPPLNFMNAKTAKDSDVETKLHEKLLSCDFNRVQLDRYDAKLLTDPNRGHWDLWDTSTDSEYTVTLQTSIYARDPAVDINASGIVGIDFGTKSTVVVYENERGEIIPLQVGKGDYSKVNVRENYENPTIIEFRHIEKFLAAYKERDGRPKTSWNDVTVSHNAQKNLLSDQLTDTVLFHSFFNEIKQWCGNLQYTTKIRDHDGYEMDLPPFSEIGKGEFNPLEYYAYYLGSYINHMLQPKHIFMSYILSFPVTYERNIRERMLRSFTDGLKKSMPTALLSNEEAMQKFQVVEGTSEPAAYAITALEGFGFMNGEADNVYYSVFDFGGGTTDFDFGVLKIATDDDADFYDFVLTHFGAHGDRTLGGENLLKLLAFEVFKANRDKLLKPRDSKDSKAKIPFTWAAEKIEFPGSEAIVRDSQEAQLNMYHLVQKLRPVWENPQSKDAQEIFKSGVIKTRVFDDAGKEIPEFTLNVGAVPSKIVDAPKKEVDAPAKIPEDIVTNAWEGDATAITRLENLASAGNSNALKELESLSSANYISATEALERLKGKISKPAKVDASKKVSTPIVDLEKILTERISRGIENFFISLRDAFDKVSGGSDNGVAVLSDVKEIKIFLAGNSTKSALVQKIFNDYTNYETGKARELLGFGKTQEMPRFTIYPPLGTDEAKKIQLDNGVEVDENNFAAPTGKTGVAFGLLRCRDGSAVRVIDISPEGKDKKTIPFQYYVGRAKMGKFQVVIDKSAKLGQWYRFIGAKIGVFDLYYTDESAAVKQPPPPISIAKRLTIRIEPDPDASVYVMASTSNTIRYTVSKDAPPPEVEGTPIVLE